MVSLIPLAAGGHVVVLLVDELAVLEVVFPATGSALLDAAEGDDAQSQTDDAGDGAVDGDLGAAGEFGPFLAERLWRRLLDFLCYGIDASVITIV
jgi:hypothetical protein